MCRRSLFNDNDAQIIEQRRTDRDGITIKLVSMDEAMRIHLGDSIRSKENEKKRDVDLLIYLGVNVHVSVGNPCISVIINSIRK